MFGLKYNRVLERICNEETIRGNALEKEVDRLLKENYMFKQQWEAFASRYSDLVNGIGEHAKSNDTIITLKDNNFPKAVLANLVATHGIDSNDCKKHQRDRDNVMSGILSAVSYGYKEFHIEMEGTLSKYVVEELQDAGYEVEPDEEGVVIRWGNAYLTPQS